MDFFKKGYILKLIDYFINKNIIMNLFNIQKNTFKVSDFIGWYNNNTLILSPDFQRNSVWNETHNSYLIDTIIRWLPIPLIILRDKLPSLDTYLSNREVVDWQQRLTAIIGYIIKREFKLKKIHNNEYPNMYFDELPTDIQQRILNYEFSVQVLPSSITDSQVLEIFSRLNSTWYKLNAQELRNAKFSWAFKESVFSISSQVTELFLKWKLFNVNEISRMKDSEFTTDLFIYMIDGINGWKPGIFNKFYKNYDKEFQDHFFYEDRYLFVLNSIDTHFWKEINDTIFTKSWMFYHLFIIFYDFYAKNDFHSKKIPNNWKNKILKFSNNIITDQAPSDIIKASLRGTNNIDSRLKINKFLTTFINEN